MTTKTPPQILSVKQRLAIYNALHEQADAQEAIAERMRNTGIKNEFKIRVWDLRALAESIVNCHTVVLHSEESQ